MQRKDRTPAVLVLIRKAKAEDKIAVVRTADFPLRFELAESGKVYEIRKTKSGGLFMVAPQS